VSPTVIFLHIGKTAGTTLRKIMYRHFAPDEVLRVRNRSQSPARLRRKETPAILASLSETERARARLVLGHVIFGLHRLLPQPSRYITLVRDLPPSWCRSITGYARTQHTGSTPGSWRKR
jgi:hypothetical protein